MQIKKLIRIKHKSEFKIRIMESRIKIIKWLYTNAQSSPSLHTSYSVTVKPCILINTLQWKWVQLICCRRITRCSAVTVIASDQLHRRNLNNQPNLRQVCVTCIVGCVPVCIFSTHAMTGSWLLNWHLV